MSTQLRFHTTAGIFEGVNPHEEIFTYLGPSSYLRKRARDLNIGDMVPVDGIRMSLAQLEPILMEDVRYSNAFDALHYYNSKGQPVKKLRVLSLRGLTGNSPDLERRIMLEDADFSRRELDPFVDKIYALNPNVERDSIYNWLSKNTGLDDWGNFEILSAINPKFKEIYDSYGKEGGFHDAYLMYTEVRRSVRSFIERRKPFAKPMQFRQPLTKRQEVVQKIVQKVFAVYDQHLTAAAIIGIDRVKIERQPVQVLTTSDARKAPRLIVGKPEGLQYKEVDITQFINNEAVLKECLWAVMEKYFLKRIEPYLLSKNFDTMGIWELTTPFVLRCIDALVKIAPLERKMFYEPHPLAERVFSFYSKTSSLDEPLERLKSDFKSGDAEAVVVIPRYSISDLIDALSRTRSTIPASYFRWEKLIYDFTVLTSLLMPQSMIQYRTFSSFAIIDDELDPKLKVEILKQVVTLDDQAKEIWKYLEGEYKIGKKKKFFYEVIDPRIKNVPDRLRIWNENTAKGHIFFVWQDIKDVLQQFNLESILSCIDSRNLSI